MSRAMVRAFMAALLLLALHGPARAATVEYIHTDALGTPVAVTNAAGRVIERSEYEPYGTLLNRPLTDGPGFTGHVSDAATGLSYMQQRYYDPGIGRFLSVDPVTADGNSGSNFNRYWYANDNPYRFTDPDGRRATTCTGSRTFCPSATQGAPQNGLGSRSFMVSAAPRSGSSRGNSNNVPAAPSPQGEQNLSTKALDAADVALTAQGILGAKKQGNFVQGELGISKWKGATLKTLRLSRQLNALGRIASVVSVGANGYGFLSAYDSGDSFGMAESFTGTAFGLAGFSWIGAPGAFTYGFGSFVLDLPGVHENTITPLLDAHKIAVDKGADAACAVTGNC